jgi:hypothetical protein
MLVAEIFHPQIYRVCGRLTSPSTVFSDSYSVSSVYSVVMPFRSGTTECTEDTEQKKAEDPYRSGSSTADFFY